MSATEPVQAVECPTPGCPGDGRYAAPGRRHLVGCRHPVAPSPEVARLTAALAARLTAEQAASVTYADQVSALAARLAAVEAAVDEWQAELDSGDIRSRDARFCWQIAVREVRAALATGTTTSDEQHLTRNPYRIEREGQS